jgi:hypothetical protein
MSLSGRVVSIVETASLAQVGAISPMGTAAYAYFTNPL